MKSEEVKVSAGLPQTDMAKCCRLVNAEAYRPGRFLAAKIGIPVNTSCFQPLAHIVTSSNHIPTVLQYVDSIPRRTAFWVPDRRLPKNF